MKRYFTIVYIAVFLLITLQGCSLISPRHQSLVVYSPALQTSALPSSKHPLLPWQLMIQTPTAINPLNSERMLVMPQPGIIEFYKNVRWRDRIPKLVQQFLLQGFQDSAQFAGVNTPGSGTGTSYGINTDVRDFQAEYRLKETPVVVIRLHIQLIDYKNNRIVDSRLFSAEFTSSDSSATAVAKSFEQGLNSLLPQIVEWVLAIGHTTVQSSSPNSTVSGERFSLYEHVEKLYRNHTNCGFRYSST